MSRELSSRDIVFHLLDSYLDARDAMDRSDDLPYSGQPDSVVLMMPPLWHQGSYAKLEEGLAALRAADALVYWHVAERFTRCTSKTIEYGCQFCRFPTETVHQHRNEFTGRMEKWPPTRISVKVVSGAVKPSLVDRGVEWLDAWFKGSHGSPWLPGPILCAVSGCAGCRKCLGRAA